MKVVGAVLARKTIERLEEAKRLASKLYKLGFITSGEYSSFCRVTGDVIEELRTMLRYHEMMLKEYDVEDEVISREGA